MSVKIIPLKQEQAHIFWKKLCSFSGDVLEFPEEALRHFRNSWTEEAIAQAAQNHRHLLLSAWMNREMVGLLLGAPPEGGVGTIIWILVAKEFQHQGIGKSLFSEACKRYREMGGHKVKLTVPSKETVEFYKKQGMQVEGFHENHWWHMDMWSMGKTL